jgi:hypothetical protein
MVIVAANEARQDFIKIKLWLGNKSPPAPV